jgi:hypothetical protein
LSRQTGGDHGLAAADAVPDQPPVVDAGGEVVQDVQVRHDERVGEHAVGLGQLVERECDFCDSCRVRCGRATSEHRGTTCSRTSGRRCRTCRASSSITSASLNVTCLCATPAYALLLAVEWVVSQLVT